MYNEINLKKLKCENCNSYAETMVIKTIPKTFDLRLSVKAYCHKCLLKTKEE